jgi:hypothetical protein
MHLADDHSILTPVGGLVGEFQMCGISWNQPNAEVLQPADLDRLRAGTATGLAVSIGRNYGRHFVAVREGPLAGKLTAFGDVGPTLARNSERLRTTGASDARRLEATAKLLNLETKCPAAKC